MTVPLLYIVDYGSGNLRSVQKAFEQVGVRAEVGADVDRLLSADGLVLPGVGAFGPAMEQLQQLGLVLPLKEKVAEGVPFLGVCLGLQLLFERSAENPEVEGLGIMPGDVRLLPPHLKVPHMGWNQAELMKDSDLFAGVPDGSSFYFVHSFAVVPQLPADVLTTTQYDELVFTSGVEAENVAGLQFHPEKSSRLGLRIYANFARRVERRAGKAA